MLTMGETTHVWRHKIYGKPLYLSVQFYCKPKASLKKKNKFLIIKKVIKIKITFSKTFQQRENASW